jgi:feruloyl esterase
MNIKRLAGSLAAATFLTVSAPATAPAGTTGQEPGGSATFPCLALAALSLPNTVVTSASAVPAQGTAPGYCRVLATVEPETDIEVRLPDGWRGRLLHVTVGGLGGTVPNLDFNCAELTRGYALTASNDGHRDPTGGPTRFLNNPTLVEDYAHGAIRKTVGVAKALVHAYYGRLPDYSYISGCSAGGRVALNAAAKYGDEYDGVLAAAPPRNFPGLLSFWAIAGQHSVPSVAKLTLLQEAQVAQCDGRDGLRDGIISNPASCRFRVETLRCAAGTNTDSCLTDDEIAAVNALRSDITLANGKIVYSRLGIGNPGTGFGVYMPVAGPGSPTFADFLNSAFLPYIVFSDPNYSTDTYDVDRDLRTVVNVIEGDFDFSANTAPLARYLRSGKKVIVWHGAEDTLVSHVDTIRSYQIMTDAAGRGADNARLYTPPGVQHCGGGPGADAFDLLAALTTWVEKDRAPRGLTASKLDAEGNVLFTRPLCEHPAYPHYDAHGDPNDASSFRCVVGRGVKGR